MYLVEFPLVLRRYYGHLAVLSVFSITTIVLCLCFVLFGGSAFNKQYRHDEVNLFSIAGVISQFGSITYSMSCNSSSIYAFTSLKQEEQTVETWRSTAFYAIVSGVGMLVLMGKHVEFLVFVNEKLIKYVYVYIHIQYIHILMISIVMMITTLIRRNEWISIYAIRCGWRYHGELRYDCCRYGFSFSYLRIYICIYIYIYIHIYV